MAAGWTIAVEDPAAADIRALLGVHLDLMRSQSPPESTHALDIEALRDPSIRFLALREASAAPGAGALLGVGALKRLDEAHGEIKSMHVAGRARGRGIAKAILGEIERMAREMGLARLSLETGAPAGFAAARGLYAANGYEPCAPFGTYRPDPFSVFMTKRIAA